MDRVYGLGWVWGLSGLERFRFGLKGWQLRRYSSIAFRATGFGVLEFMAYSFQGLGCLGCRV